MILQFKALVKGQSYDYKGKTYSTIISETQNFDCMRNWGYKICKIGVWLIWDLLWCQAGAEGWGDFNRKCKSWIIEDLGELLLEVKLNPGCCPVVSPAVACLLYNSFCAPTWSSYTLLPSPFLNFLLSSIPTNCLYSSPHFIQSTKS